MDMGRGRDMAIEAAGSVTSEIVLTTMRATVTTAHIRATEDIGAIDLIEDVAGFQASQKERRILTKKSTTKLCSF
jgi:hypothetical protein